MQPQGTLGPSCVAPVVVPLTTASAVVRLIATAPARVSFAGPGVMHMPDMHVAVPVQALPHEPQLELSLFRLAHVDPHTVRPLEQPQVPPLQVIEPEHACPQLPQLPLSLVTSTHVKPHIINGAVHPLGQLDDDVAHELPVHEPSWLPLALPCRHRLVVKHQPQPLIPVQPVQEPVPVHGSVPASCVHIAPFVFQFAPPQLPSVDPVALPGMQRLVAQHQPQPLTVVHAPHADAAAHGLVEPSVPVSE